MSAVTDPFEGHFVHCYIREGAHCSCGHTDIFGVQKNADSLCRCGHTKARHQDASGLGGAQCKDCPGDDERSWRHPFIAETNIEETQR